MRGGQVGRGRFGWAHWRNESGQVMEGWIDTLLKLPNDQRILIDHKTYPGTDPIGHIRENYLGQLTTYTEALEITVGMEPLAVLVHLPLLGVIVKCASREMSSSPGKTM